MTNDIYILTIEEQGEIQLVESFGSSQGLKDNLIKGKYFNWINDNEPNKALPNFQDVETLDEIKAIFEAFDYSWWTVSVKKISDYRSNGDTERND